MLLCSFVLVGETHAQEVIVARETKPEAPKQAAPPPEQTPSESPTPAKPKSRGKRSTSAEPTLEQTRQVDADAGGAEAAKVGVQPGLVEVAVAGEGREADDEGAADASRAVVMAPPGPEELSIAGAWSNVPGLRTG